MSASFLRGRCGRVQERGYKGDSKGDGVESFWGLPGSCANFERKFIACFIICLSLLLLLVLSRFPYPIYFITFPSAAARVLLF